MSKPRLEPVEITRDAAVSSDLTAMSSGGLDRAHSTTRLSRSPLSHPLFLSSLALLLLNDHVLKTSNVLPEALTGKLSDFAGLLVAPIVLVALLRAKHVVSRALSFALVAFVFAAINLSPEAARLFERATALIGMPWSVFVDASDLIGFVVYPLAWWISDSGVAVDRPRDRRVLAVAALACAASAPEAEWTTSAYLINRTEDPIEVQLRWAHADLDCEAISGRVADVFAPDLFSDTVTFTLEPTATLAMEELNASQREGVMGLNPCDVAMLQVDGLPDTMLFWTQASRTNVPFTVEEEDEDDLKFNLDGMVVLEHDKKDRLVLRTHAGVEAAQPVESIADPECVEPMQRFGWSTLPEPFTAELVELGEGADGCLTADFAGTERLYLCIPKEEMPFTAGSTLTVAGADQPGSRSLFMTRETAEERITLSVWSGALDDAPVSGTLIDRDGCGRRLECGGYAVPASLELPDGSRVASGAAIEIESAGKSMRLVLGSAEHLLVGNERCEPNELDAGGIADILWVTREVK